MNFFPKTDTVLYATSPKRIVSGMEFDWRRIGERLENGYRNHGGGCTML